MIETIKRYIVVEEDKSKSLWVPWLSCWRFLMTGLGSQRYEPKIIDDIKIFLKLAMADYMLMKNNSKGILKNWEILTYQEFEPTRPFNHKFNRAFPAFQTIVTRYITERWWSAQSDSVLVTSANLLDAWSGSILTPLEIRYQTECLWWKSYTTRVSKLLQRYARTQDIVLSLELANSTKFYY